MSHAIHENEGMTETTENQVPYSEKTYYSVTETAKLLRGALKQKFPGQKFSVRSDSYAGGASIRVRWTDGPTKTEVEHVTFMYTGASFDGMIDLKSYHDSILVGEDGVPRVVHFGADYIFTERDFSPEMETQVTATYERLYGRPYDSNYHDGSRWASDRRWMIGNVSHLGVEPNDEDAFYGRQRALSYPA